ncbi:hypothetical protein BU25DRAFT_461362 [Macroventuria anomochaeta]|uniref:Uncharacterized protein n=1 Tax=Macroventuria anomochaeta TaxID=301207 RepID=A0ACB6RSC4_9PLEO|nr:uncharacterized protein BU25DRAFT_461362 [Macroventuria anomochaeta]KAF2624177.1 hypothetical protein BU25DRAFT_461362 [Macroventuria anomochaeta]
MFQETLRIGTPRSLEIGAPTSVSSSQTSREQAGAGKRGTTWATPGLKSDHYRPVDTFEGLEKYDPDFEGKPEEERKRMCTFVCLIFFAFQLDRGNISQALSDNILDGLGMNTNEYNYDQVIFFICFLYAELPSQLISKKIGPDKWIPIQMVSRSLVASMQAFLSGKSSFYKYRAPLGLIEGGFIPDNILYLSYEQISAYVLFIIQLLFWTWVSERVNDRFLVSLVSQICALPLLIALERISPNTSPWSRWILAIMLVCHPYVQAITSRNSSTVRARTVASALYYMTVQASSIFSQNIYREDDKPLYRWGNKVLIAVCAYNFALLIGAKVFYVTINKRREAVWSSMSREDKNTYLDTTKDEQQAPRLQVCALSCLA